MNKSILQENRWLYFKVYCGIKESDLFLTKCIIPFVEKKIKAKNIQKWFFIRYNEGGYHLRIRFLCTTNEDIPLLFSSFFDEARKKTFSCLIWKIQIDNYNREIERYGKSTINMVESIFESDSNFICSFISKLKNDNDEKNRWKQALKIVDNYFSFFNIDINLKHKIISMMTNSLKLKLGESKVLNVQINNFFRENNSEIFDILFLNKREEDFIINVSSENVKNSLNKDGIPIEKFLFDLIHMSFNRLFRVQQNEHELIIYSLMEKAYKSQIKKTRCLK